MSRLGRFAWAVLALNLLVVGWGAFVRATGSGAGCGRHWPTCNGEIVPRAPALATTVEFAHRASSGIALVLVIALAVWAVRALPARHAGRRAAWTAVGFMIAEALVGAGLVLFGWVAKDTSSARGWVMAVHLTNTFLLLASLALTAAWASAPAAAAGLSTEGRRPAAGALGFALGAMLVAGVTGAIAALGDTLFPAASFAEGLRAELSSDAHVLLRLRLLHPPTAALAGGLVLVAARAAARARREPRVLRLASAAAGLVAVEIAVGALNVLWAAPIPLQLVHLLLADVLWIALVLLGAAALTPGGAATGERLAAAAPSAP